VAVGAALLLEENMKNTEWNRLGNWVSQTSMYLDVALPQLDYFIVDFVGNCKLGNCKLRMVIETGNTRFVRNVVLPEITSIAERVLKKKTVIMKHVKQTAMFEYQIKNKGTQLLARSLFLSSEQNARNRRRYFLRTGTNVLLTSSELLYRLEEEECE
jgi:3-hydroxymyristoyl/3-hydroxydecanoyl-(acyl carrier protein) dehydratase